jgi:hypothetical protein
VDWRRLLPLTVVNLIRTATRAVIGVTLVLVSLFVCWFTYELLRHLRGFLARCLFSWEW